LFGLWWCPKIAHNVLCLGEGGENLPKTSF